VQGTCNTQQNDKHQQRELRSPRPQVAQ
jgi:hypothetical protein